MDPKQVAQALLNRYKETPRAVAINREAEGVPFLLAPSSAPAVAQTKTSSDAELQQAMSDVERDLQELTTNTLLKDVTPELQGWSTAATPSCFPGSLTTVCRCLQSGRWTSLAADCSPSYFVLRTVRYVLLRSGRRATVETDRGTQPTGRSAGLLPRLRLQC